MNSTITKNYSIIIIDSLYNITFSSTFYDLAFHLIKKLNISQNVVTEHSFKGNLHDSHSLYGGQQSFGFGGKIEGLKLERQVK